jgi:FlaA1/EpsC-like NDP-sugar epimerase
MNNTIFYGAGEYAKKHIKEWMEIGIIPACFADQDVNKHGKKINDIEIVSLNNAIDKIPDYTIVITVDTKYAEVFDYLCDQGIDKKRISFIFLMLLIMIKRLIILLDLIHF